MASEEKILQVGETQDTPQAITITIMDPSALGNASLDSSLVATVKAQDCSDPSSIVMVPGDDHGSKDILQTVTETHMGSEDLPIISNISNPEEEEEEEMIVHETKLSESFDGGGEEVDLGETYDAMGVHCLVCNIDLTSKESDDQVSVFKTQTSTTQRRVAVFLSGLVGQKLTSRKAHSDILCRRCFSLLDRVDSLEVEIKETKEEIVNKYQETVSVYGGRARRRKPAIAKKTDYVFPKVEPEDETEQLMDMELDGNFEPRVEDLMEEDPSLQDDDWEPEFKKPRIKKETADIVDTEGPPKRKRGRPRKDASRSKDGEFHTKLSLLVEVKEKDTEQQRVSPSADLSVETQDSEALALQLADESLTCSCGIQCATLMEHVEHVLTHAAGAFRCPDCDCSYTTSTLLARHQRLIHSPDAPPKLSISSSESTSKGDVCPCGESVHDTHLVDHARGHLKGQDECPVCALRLVTTQALEVHVEQKHSQFLIVFLKDKEAQDRGGTQDSEGGVQPVRCDVCGKVVCTNGRLTRHRYLHHPEHYPWQCSSCTLAFPSLGARRLHTCSHRRKGETVESSRDEKHECSLCSVVFDSRMNLEHHMRRSHAVKGTAPFTCPVCPRSVESRKALTDHLRCHRRQRFPCEFCGAKLKTLDSLNVHVNELHTHVVRQQCKLCSQVFFSSGRLSYHMKRHHTDRRSYTNLCHLCGKAYPYPSELRLHLRSHRNERPYKCDQCHKTFLKQGDLTYHKRSHTGERPHKCPHCDARYPRPNTLMSHIRYQHCEVSGVRTTTTSINTTNTTTSITSTSTLITPITPTITTTATPGSTPSCAVTTNTAATISTTEIAVSTGTVASYMPSSVADSGVSSTAPYLTTVNAAAFAPRPPTMTVMTVPGGVPRAPAPPTLVPVVEGQLVNTVVGGHVTEMQPVQYVQVDGLSASQAVHAVPHAVQGVEYTEAATMPYQIVHFQILQ